MPFADHGQGDHRDDRDRHRKGCGRPSHVARDVEVLDERRPPTIGRAREHGAKAVDEPHDRRERDWRRLLDPGLERRAFCNRASRVKLTPIVPAGAKVLFVVGVTRHIKAPGALASQCLRRGCCSIGRTGRNVRREIADAAVPTGTTTPPKRCSYEALTGARSLVPEGSNPFWRRLPRRRADARNRAASRGRVKAVSRRSRGQRPP